MKSKFAKGALIVNTVWMLASAIRTQVIQGSILFEFAYVLIAMISLGMALEDS